MQTLIFLHFEYICYLNINIIHTMYKMLLFKIYISAHIKISKNIKYYTKFYKKYSYKTLNVLTSTLFSFKISFYII